MTPYLTRSTWTHLKPPFPIERMRLRRVVSIKWRIIWAVDLDHPLHPTAAHKSTSFKFSSSRRKNLPVDFHQILLVYCIISRVVCFIVLLTHFRTHWLFEINVLLKEEEEFTSWTLIFVFGISEWKAMHPTINWIILKANLGYIACFHLNLSSFSVNFTFWIVD